MAQPKRKGGPAAAGGDVASASAGTKRSPFTVDLGKYPELQDYMDGLKNSTGIPKNEIIIRLIRWLSAQDQIQTPLVLGLLPDIIANDPEMIKTLRERHSRQRNE